MSTYRQYGRGDEVQVEEGDSVFHGVSQRLAADKLGSGLLADGKNVRLRDGAAETRLGVTKPGWLNGIGTGTTITPVAKAYGAGTFRDPNSEEWTLLAGDGLVYRCKPGNVRFALALPTSVRVLGDCSFCQAFNQVFLFRGKYLQPLVMSSVDTGFLDVVARWSSSTVYNAAVLATGQAAQEVAYGPYQSVTTLTSVGDLATVVTPVPHGYITGADVTITGAVQTAYNGRWNITVIDESTFTYHFTGGTSPATGTVKVSNSAYYWRGLGSLVTLTALTRAGTTATATKAGHGFSNGQYVTISGATPAGFNGTYLIFGVAANTFQYTMAADPGADGTVMPTARTSVVLAGQSPDTNAEAWQQIYNVLPNADDAIFANNRMLVPTAYTPGNVDYDSTSTYTKKDFVVALDIGDNVHFSFTNEFRINQGDDSEIVCLVKYNQDQVIVIKGRVWGILGGLSSSDLSLVTLDMRGDAYGGCAPRSAVVAGKNVLFPSTARGVCSLMQNELGQVRSVDVPFSNEVDDWVARINWTLGNKIRMAWWEDRLYVAVPMDDGTLGSLQMVPTTAVYSSLGFGAQRQYTVTGLEVGKTYVLTLGNATQMTTSARLSGGVVVPSGTGIGAGRFVATQTAYNIWGGPVGATVTATVQRVLTGVCNALLVYDFRCQRGSTDATEYDFQSGQWASLDSGSALCVKEFFLANYNGRQRLFFLAEDGYASMMEEAVEGDQVGRLGTATGLAWEALTSEILTRGFKAGTESPKQYKRAEVVFDVWNATLNIWKRTASASSEVSVVSGLTFSRTKYLRPVGRVDYVEGNGNGDYATPGRGDYSVRLLGGGISTGQSVLQYQEVTKRVSVRTTAGRSVQLRVQTTTGRMKVKAVTPTMNEGQRRSGILLG